jgi:hypothetical protein
MFIPKELRSKGARYKMKLFSSFFAVLALVLPSERSFLTV